MTSSQSPDSQQEAMTDAVLEANRKDQQEKGPDLRQVHAKSHSLVWGEFIVESNIPETIEDFPLSFLFLTQ